MRILLIGPNHAGGSIPPYLDVFAAGLRLLGAHVDRLGSSGVPYDKQEGRFWPADQVVQAARHLLRDVDLNAYDVLSVHFGNLDVEQLLPHLWPSRRPPAVYHVHSLDWTLFTEHVPEPRLREAVEDGVAGMDAFVYFGSYGASALGRLAGHDVPSIVSWLPTTIPPGTSHRHTDEIAAVVARRTGALASLYGYAAPWKDPVGLIEACRRTTVASHVVVAGPLWDDPTQAGADLTAELLGAVHGATQLRFMPTYLDASDRKALVSASDYAIFPYRSQPTFQGSGAIADYLAHSVPVLATHVANMAELIGDAGVVVEPADPQSLASAIDRFAGDKAYRDALAAAARRRARCFSAAYHAARCLRLYETLKRRMIGTPT